MIYHKVISVSIVGLIGAVTSIPDHLLCCKPEMGTFRKIDNETSHCWHEQLNKSSSLPITCPFKDTFETYMFNLNITEAGKVFHVDPNLPPLEFTSGDSCFDNETDEATGEVREVVIMCLDEPEDERLVGYSMLVSVVFYVMTMLVYLFLPEVRDLLGKSIISFCGSIALGLGTLSYQKLMDYSDMGWCAARGFLIYFFLIASFFWTNAISIQMLLSFSYARPMVNNYGWKEFSWYSLYAWGCPIILTVAMAIVNYHPGEHRKPGIGLNTCWFFTQKEQWQYMYCVMTILILANFCIFIYTSVRLCRFSFSSNHIKALKYKFHLSIRMIIIMGLSWIFEMISTLTEKSIIWVITDVFNTLQGPLIFLILVVLRKRVTKALLKRGYLDCISGPIERCLAKTADDEEGVIEHTVDVTMIERNGAVGNGNGSL